MDGGEPGELVRQFTPDAAEEDALEAWRRIGVARPLSSCR
jgi:hypothetical protein